MSSSGPTETRDVRFLRRSHGWEVLGRGRLIRFRRRECTKGSRDPGSGLVVGVKGLSGSEGHKRRERSRSYKTGGG